MAYATKSALRVLFVAGVLLLGSTSVAGAQTAVNDDYTVPTVSVDPPCAVVGQQLTVTGTGFAPGNVALTFNSNGFKPANTTADRNGRFAFRSATPAVAPGVYTVTATQGPLTASSQVTVAECEGEPLARTGEGEPLARTGSGTTIPLIRVGIALLACGGVTLALARRRGRRSVVR